MDTAVAIVGAGPYGLSVAAHLAEHGVDFRLFGPPMATWRESMPAGMLLKSDGFASSLSAPVPDWTLGEYCRRAEVPYGDREPRVRLEDFAEYGLAFQRHFAPESDPRLVSRVSPLTGGFSLTLQDGSVVTAERVVIAVGITHFAHLPEQLATLGDRASHSGGHRTFERFCGLRVAVIGAGSSATVVAAGLVDAGARVHVLARRPEILFWAKPSSDARSPSLLEQLRNPSSGLGPGMRNWLYQRFPDAFRCFPAERRLRAVNGHLGPLSPWWVRDRVMEGTVVRTRTTPIAGSVSDGVVTLTLRDAGGERSDLAVDHVICATGYRADIDRLEFLDASIRGTLRRVGQMPELSHNFESSYGGVYFVGPAAAGAFGPLLRFVVGSEFAGPRIGRHLARVSRRAPSRRPRVVA